MSGQLPMHYRVFAVAIVIAALVIASSISASTYLGAEKTVTNDVTRTSVQTQTVLNQTTLTLTTTNTGTVTSTITISGSNYTTTATVVENHTITTTTTTTVNNPIPWYGLTYVSASGGCTVSSGASSYPAPCQSSSSPYVFDCTAAAATSQGCTVTVEITGSTKENYTITIWYPYHGSQPYQNCYWTQDLPGQPQFEQINAYCIPVNATSFIISEPILSTFA